MAIIKDTTLASLRTMVRGEYAARLAELMQKPAYKDIATIITSGGASNTYGWLGDFPKMREWVGDRVIADMKEMSYQILNKLYEATLGVKRTDIEDDNLGQYRVLSRAQADEVVRFLNELTFGLLPGGFSALCFDGQNFFDVDHPVYPNVDGTGVAVSTSNVQGDPAATGSPWFLLSLTGTLKPFIVQDRAGPEFEEITDGKAESVFMRDQFLYGTRWRGNAGYGFWQQAVGSKATLDATAFEAAYDKMLAFKRDGGSPLGIVPSHLVVGPANRAAAKAILEKEFLAGGESNPNYKAVELIVSPWIQ